MIDILSALAILSAIFLVAGAPLALRLRGTDSGWGWLLVDAVTYGLVLVTLGIVAWIWVGAVGVAAIAVFWLLTVVSVILTRSLFPSFWRPRGREWLLVGAWVAVLATTVFTRLRVSNFLPWVGDMGAYVNWANEFVRTGEFKSSWPPFFPAYLSIGSRLFGDDFTTVVVPLTGILLVLVIARVLRRFGVGQWATVTVALLASLSVHFIWYSSFPASESLNAPLFLVWIGSLLAVVRSDRARLPWWLAANGILMLALGMLRGTGPLLLLPLLILAAAALAIPDWRGLARRIWLAFSVSLVGALVSYWYGIQMIPKYYVDTQIPDLMPGSLFDALDRVHVFEPVISTALILVIVGALICGGGLLLARRLQDSVRATRVPARITLIVGIIIALGVIGGAFLNADVWQIILRAGLWLTVAAALTVMFAGRLRLAADATALVTLSGGITAMFLGIHTYRLKFSRGHSFHLYWDRYLVSELLPLFFLLLGIGLSAAWTLWFDRRTRALWESPKPLVKAVPVVVVVALLAAAVVPTAAQLRLVTEHAYMEGAFEFEQALVDLVPSDETPVVWGATTEAQADGFFFANTWLAFAKPMQRSYGLDMVNVGGRGNDFAPDEVFTADMLEQEAVCNTTDTLMVLEADTGGTPLDERVAQDGFTLTDSGEVTSELDLLSQPATNGDWTVAEITVRAWTVDFDDAALAGITCAE